MGQELVINASEPIHDQYTSICKLEVNWNLEAVTRNSEPGQSSGFIVQKVTISIESYPPLSTDISYDYYEAWEVAQGKVEKHPACEYDDVFSIGTQIGTRFDAIADCLGTAGSIVFTGDVYWVDSNMSLYQQIMEWPRGGVAEAGTLRSMIGIEMCDLEECYIGTRPEFSHSWNCREVDTIYRVLLREASRYVANDRDLKSLKHNLKYCLDSLLYGHNDYLGLRTRVYNEVLKSQLNSHAEWAS